MNIEQLTASLVEKGTKLGVLEATHAAMTTELTTVKAELATTKTELTAANTKVTTLEAAATTFAATDTAKLATEKATAEDNAEKARLALMGEANRMNVALNLAKMDEKADIPTLLAALETNRTKMTETFAKPGVLVASGSAEPKRSAFKGA